MPAELCRIRETINCTCNLYWRESETYATAYLFQPRVRNEREVELKRETSSTQPFPLETILTSSHTASLNPKQSNQKSSMIRDPLASVVRIQSSLAYRNTPLLYYPSVRAPLLDPVKCSL